MGYKDEQGWSQAPGYGPEISADDRAIFMDGSIRDFDSKWLLSTAVDNQHTDKTTRLRPGLVLVPNVARTFYVNPEHADAVAAADLLVNDPVVLAEYREMKDGAGVVQNITAKVAIAGKLISERLLFGSATSDPDKALIKAAMPNIQVIAGHEPL